MTCPRPSAAFRGWAQFKNAIKYRSVDLPMTDPSSPVTQKLYRAAGEILGLIREDETDRAYQKISAFQGDASVTRFTLIRVLVSTGQRRCWSAPSTHLSA